MGEKITFIDYKYPNSSVIKVEVVDIDEDSDTYMQTLDVFNVPREKYSASKMENLAEEFWKN